MLDELEEPVKDGGDAAEDPGWAPVSALEENFRAALDDGCGYDAPGSLAAYWCSHEVVYAMEMPGKRFDVGNLESYRKIGAEYKGYAQ